VGRETDSASLNFRSRRRKRGALYGEGPQGGVKTEKEIKKEKKGESAFARVSSDKRKKGLEKKTIRSVRRKGGSTKLLKKIGPA